MCTIDHPVRHRSTRRGKRSRHHEQENRLTSVEPGSVRNRLLKALPPRVLAELLPRLRRVDLRLRADLVTPSKPATTAFFPESGWASLLVTLEDGTMAEVGLVGLEGFVGLNAVFGAGPGLMSAVVQARGTALAIDATVLGQAMEKMPAVRSLLMRYALTFNVQVATTAACNVRHPLNKRLARWLLMSHDRSEGDEFPMTHEFLAMMLGVRRAGVSVAAAALRDAGLICYRQGHVHIIDRAGLEEASCGCHHLLKTEFDKLQDPMACQPCPLPAGGVPIRR